MTRLTIPILAIALAFAIGCSVMSKPSTAANEMAMQKVSSAVAVITPTKGNAARGTVWFEQDGNKVHVTGELAGLTPNTTHGFHVHEFGDISSDNGEACGGHYNPGEVDHALPHQHPRHAGDLGNVTADGKGNTKIDITVDTMSIAGHRNAILGRGLIVHAKPDDGGQPTGNAGDRIGQGVIGVAK